MSLPSVVSGGVDSPPVLRGAYEGACWGAHGSRLLSVALAPTPSASRGRWRVARSERCGGSLPGYLLRALVGRDVRGEVGLYPARCVLRDPPSALFVLAAPEGVYLSAIGMPISPPLLRAACPR